MNLKHRIYQPGKYQVGAMIELEPDAANHIGVVLRLQEGDEFILFDGQGQEAIVKVYSKKKRQVIVQLIETQSKSIESPLKLHLAPAIIKKEKMTFLIQKSCELGVNEITPLMSARVSVKMDKTRLEKQTLSWQKTIIAATEQCGRTFLPKLNPAMSFIDFVKLHTEDGLLLHPKGIKSLKEVALSQSAVTLMIGPEGGFSEEELEFAGGLVQTYRMGSRVLRAETAAIASLATMQALYGDML